jgi:D-alanine--poly(phosphoribitol) ligase subunit 1
VVREALRAGPKDLRPEVDPASGEMKLRATFRVVEKVENKKDEIEFEHAKTFKADVQVGEDLELLLTPRDFGRIMGQNAWAVIQRRRERGEIEEPPKPVSGDGPHCFSVPISISDPTQSAGSALTHMPEGVLETIRAASKKAMRGASDEADDPRDLRAEIDPTLGEIKLGTKFSVVEKVENGDNEIGLELARTLKADVQVGEDLEVLLSPEDFGRIMGQNAAEVMKRHREQGVKEGKPSWMPKPVSGDDPYYIIFTSGSTGEPKGVVITLNCLTTFVIWTLGEQKFPDLDETFLNQAPFSFDLSVMDLYSSLASGGTLFSITREAIANPKVLYQQLAKSGITTWVSTPSFAQMCLVEKSFGPEMLPQIRRFWFCGETLANETAAQLLDRFPNAEVWNTYGPTEATVATTSIRVDRDVITNHAPLPVGYVMPGTRIAIMDENRATVPEGERGEIVIIGPNVSPGYLGRADLTEKAFFATESTRAYRTGDWGRTRGGLIFFEGRMDGQIKLHGYRIELGDIESHLRNLPQISDAVVLVAEKNGKPDSLAGFVVLRERGTGSDFDISLQFKKLLGERLPTYMVPRKFWFLDAFPMTANGKADRRKLAELLR